MWHSAAAAQLMTPSFLPTCLNASTVLSTSSKLCAADSCTRIRALPLGTTGKLNPITKMPRSATG